MKEQAKPAAAAAPTPDGSDLGRLFEQHNAALVQFLRARLRSDQEARDVAQEAYVRLLQLDRVGTIGYLRTYLFRTALNLATDRMRSAAVRRAAHRDPIFDAGVHELSPDRIVDAGESLAAVARAIESLPPRPRVAFLLHRIAGRDVAEVALRMGVTKRMVRNYLLQALVKCAQALENGRPGDARGKSRGEA